MTTESQNPEKKTELTSATETPGSTIDPRDKNGWLRKAQETFGPDVEFVRVSSPHRSGRFVVAKAIRRVDLSRGVEIVTLGTGSSWAEAVERSCQSDLGRGAIADNLKALALAQAAMKSKSPAEFADHVLSVTLEEAKANGATEAELDELKTKFANARKHLE